jgi:hypothetical protein
MKPIRIFDQSLSLIAEIDDYESLQYTRRLYTYGEFEININYNKQNAEYLQRNNIILVGSDLNKLGIIKHIEIGISEDGKGSETVKAIGYTLDYLFTDRIILPTAGNSHDAITDDAETVIKHYIANCITSPLDSDRDIAFFNLKANLSRGIAVAWQARYTNLSEDMQAILTTVGYGLDIRLNTATTKIDIDLLIGADKTYTSPNPVIFSHEFDNIESQVYVESEIGNKNVAYVGDAETGTSRTVTEVGTSTGINRKEIFVDAKDLTTGLADRGAQELAQYPLVQTFEGGILTYGVFEYEFDWDLGDTVTIQNKKWGVTMDAKITEVKEIYEVDGFNLEAVFGNNIPSFTDILKARLKRKEQ